MNIEIYPLDKIVIDGVAVTLGWKKLLLNMQLEKDRSPERDAITLIVRWRLITAITK